MARLRVAKSKEATLKTLKTLAIQAVREELAFLYPQRSRSSDEEPQKDEVIAFLRSAGVLPEIRAAAASLVKALQKAGIAKSRARKFGPQNYGDVRYIVQQHLNSDRDRKQVRRKEEIDGLRNHTELSILIAATEEELSEVLRKFRDSLRSLTSE